jgi:hypothetical protein
VTAVKPPGQACFLRQDLTNFFRGWVPRLNSNQDPPISACWVIRWKFSTVTYWTIRKPGLAAHLESEGRKDLKFYSSLGYITRPCLKCFLKKIRKETH